MGITDGDISGVRNKIVRGQLLQRQKKEKAQNKLKKRIERKEAENRGEVVERGQSRSLSSTVEFVPENWHSHIFSQAGRGRLRTRKSGSETTRSMRTRERDRPRSRWTRRLATFESISAPSRRSSPPPPRPPGTPTPTLLLPQSPRSSSPPRPGSPRVCFPRISSTTFRPCLAARDGQTSYPGGVPSLSWARSRDGHEDVGMEPSPSSVRTMRSRVSFEISARASLMGPAATLTLSLLPNGPTAHFRLTGVTLSQDIKVSILHA